VQFHAESTLSKSRYKPCTCERLLSEINISTSTESDTDKERYYTPKSRSGAHSASSHSSGESNLGKLASAQVIDSGSHHAFTILFVIEEGKGDCVHGVR